MSSRAFSVVVAILGIALVGADDKPVNITGIYACKGDGDTGGNYEGKVEITKNGDAYKVEWTLASGESYEGVGIRSGNILLVSWKSGNSSGIVVYAIEKGDKGPKLNGKWSGNPGNGKLLSENLTYEKGVSQ
jgi:hypothetical protein